MFPPRASVIDYEDAETRAMSITGRQNRIFRHRLQVIRFGTFQQPFPLVPDQGSVFTPALPAE